MLDFRHGDGGVTRRYFDRDRTLQEATSEYEKHDCDITVSLTQVTKT